MSGLDDIKVTVSLLTVVYAIRYGMGRLSYANADAAMLAATYWNLFSPAIRQQIISDALGLPRETAGPWEWLRTGDDQ